MKILVTDGLEAEALATLRKHHEVDAIEADPKQLLDLIGGYEAVIVRSRTKVTAEALAKGSRLKAVGRAGIGVGNNGGEGGDRAARPGRERAHGEHDLRRGARDRPHALPRPPAAGGGPDDEGGEVGEEAVRGPRAVRGGPRPPR